MTDAQIRESMVYAIANLDGGGCLLTVFEKDNEATIELSKAKREQMIRLLSAD